MRGSGREFRRRVAGVREGERVWSRVSWNRKSRESQGGLARGRVDRSENISKARPSARQYQSQDFDRNMTSFLFFNFLEDWNVPHLWKAFKYYGNVGDIYMARRRMLNGKRFGFVRFKNELEGCERGVGRATEQPCMKEPYEKVETESNRDRRLYSEVVKQKWVEETSVEEDWMVEESRTSNQEIGDYISSRDQGESTAEKIERGSNRSSGDRTQDGAVPTTVFVGGKGSATEGIEGVQQSSFESAPIIKEKRYDDIEKTKCRLRMKRMSFEIW
ncbi:hypothetical protein L6452_34045 [Arctium lappa]|uniref:Uncharacterized protein n=1 Tax=Arctium lappa TaxID=4217 RepID=A0ACB8YIQ5_ARCLA|nr:hypothetical protein L6452_34045 [Arctium lappa]